MWSLSFLVLIWAVWKERNRRCFEGSSCNDIQLGDKIKHSVAIWAFYLHHFKGISPNSIIFNWKEVAFSNLLKQRVLQRWQPTRLGALKLNFDGSAFGNPGLAGVGGVLHNEEGSILLSFSAQLGFSLITKLNC